MRAYSLLREERGQAGGRDCTVYNIIPLGKRFRAGSSGLEASHLPLTNQMRLWPYCEVAWGGRHNVSLVTESSWGPLKALTIPEGAEGQAWAWATGCFHGPFSKWVERSTRLLPLSSPKGPWACMKVAQCPTAFWVCKTGLSKTLISCVVQTLVFQGYFSTKNL